MNELVDMAGVRAVLGMGGKSNRLVTRRLRLIAEERGGVFQLFKVGKAWMTTREDLRRLLPELVMHDAADGDSLRVRCDRQAVQLEELRRRVVVLENTVFQLTKGRKAA